MDINSGNGMGNQQIIRTTELGIVPECESVDRKINLAWAAGLFDGEGMFGIHKSSKGHYHIVAKLQMTHCESVVRFHSIVKVGQIHLETNQPSHWKNTHIWCCYNDSPKVAKLLLPYLFTKQEQAEKIIEFDSVWRRRYNMFHEPWSLDEVLTMNFIHKEMTVLNKRGR